MKKTRTIFILLYCTVFFACRINTPGIALITGDFVPPKLVSIEVINEQEVKIDFTKPVTPAVFSVCRAGEDAVPVLSETMQDTAVVINLPQTSIIGEKYTLQGAVIDSNGNTLSFITEFTGFNGRPPKLVLSEVRVDAAKPKTEFIELYARSAGNLAGVSLFSSHSGEIFWYEFPAAEIKEGEYILLHMRSIEAGITDETDATDVSSGTETLPSARDFWVEGNTKHLSKMSVILLYERKNGKLLDALLLNESKNTAWPKPVHAEAAKIAFESGVWPEGWEPSFAVVSDGMTESRTISRQGDLQKAASLSKNDWIIVSTRGATPGTKNSDKPYAP